MTLERILLLIAPVSSTRSRCPQCCTSWTSSWRRRQESTWGVSFRTSGGRETFKIQLYIFQTKNKSQGLDLKMIYFCVTILNLRVLPAPWLQPCCNPPFCSCDHYKNPDEGTRWPRQTSLNENVHICAYIMYVVSGILITLSLSKVMDLLMETVRNVGGGKSDEYFAGFEEEEGSVKDEWKWITRGSNKAHKSIW